jgi:methylenetetrahydrofolate--tRNA-(uracil-5-)-methyltransferase
MNINYGLLPPMEDAPRTPGAPKVGKRDRARARKRAIADRALADVEKWGSLLLLRERVSR